jgi:hypothetical protein
MPLPNGADCCFGPFANAVRTVGLILIGLVVAIALASLVAPGRIGMSSAYDQYLCTACGLKRADEIRKIGPITYRHRVSYEDSALSRELRAKQCSHTWLLYRNGHSFHGLSAGYFADGGCQSQAVPLLVGDGAFALELARMQSPGKVWGSLVATLNSSRVFDEAFLEWWQNPERGTFSNWAATNGVWMPPTLK